MSYKPPTLFDNVTGNPTEWGGYGRPGAAPHESPATSVSAAHQIEPVSGRLRIIVYDAIVASGSHGRICDELEEELQMKHQTCSARMRELAQQGHITNKLDAAGKEMKRNTRSGRGAFVFVAVRR